MTKLIGFLLEAIALTITALTWALILVIATVVSLPFIFAEAVVRGLQAETEEE